jgi:hypothetical protein
MNSQNRAFIKQVQMDLLALSDKDLLTIIEQWVHKNILVPSFADACQPTFLALGYTRVSQASTLPYTSHSVLNDDREEPEQWIAPSAQQLREHLLKIDINSFDRYIITLAFQALHETHPDWYEGVTFNAQLANCLRHMKTKGGHAF